MRRNTSRFPGSGPSGAQKSKRISDSTSSNNQIAGTSNSKKKRKISQQTLGVAWGASSIPSSRSSFRSAPFSDFGSYMTEKNRKLQNQFDAQASRSSNGNPSSRKPLFHGVSIFVDGFTVPSSQELKGYMLKYGGRFENYFSRHRVTHIICSNLPDTKIRNIRSFSGGLPVVKPTWILESVAANRVLSWVPYQLEQLANKQPNLSAFFTMESCSATEDTSTSTSLSVGMGSMEFPANDTSNNGCLPEIDQAWSGGKMSRENGSSVLERSDATVIHESSRSGYEKSCEETFEDLSHDEPEDDNGLNAEHLFRVDECTNASGHSHYSESKKVIQSSSTPPVQPSMLQHSTIGDPNFVENYFKNSRLHFIGTWRSRYRRRYPNSYNGVNCSNHFADAKQTIICHIDMDCFFVSVVIKNRHDLKDKPVAICHSDNPKGTAEISSANYPAREYGIKAGMFVRDAKALFSQLVILPYNFEAYEMVADQFYSILHKHCNKVQAVSCDEAFLDVSDRADELEAFASAIRKEIFDVTGCTASVGIAANMLLSRLATRSAKPDGQCWISPEKADEYLCQLPLKQLPGIGHVLEEKLKKQSILTCGQLRLVSKEVLQRDFGTKTGEMLWNYSRGVDNRLVGMIQESKSIGAEVNWGVRFRNSEDVQRFLVDLCKEVSLRLQGCGVQGRMFTLKIKKRRQDAGEPVKFMGCGDCENLSHSVTVPVATDEVEVLQRIAKQLYGNFHLDVKDVRGVGLQVSKLESLDASGKGLQRSLKSCWLMSTVNSEGQRRITDVTKNGSKTGSEGCAVRQTTHQISTDPGAASEDRIMIPAEAHQSSNHTSVLPPLEQLDMGIVESLPPDLLAEVNEMYSGKLVDFIASRVQGGNILKPDRGTTTSVGGPCIVDPAPLNKGAVDSEQVDSCVHEGQPMVLASAAGCSNVAVVPISDLMPSSLSQVDMSVLEELPEELKVDVLELLPPHRDQISSNAPTVPGVENLVKPVDITTGNQLTAVNCPLNNDLWVGDPPSWVSKFRTSNFTVLNILADMYYKVQPGLSLSSVLQSTISATLHSQDVEFDGWHEAIGSIIELLKQYIKLKVEVDIEEIYICFRFLRRLKNMSKFYSEVYDAALPYLQVITSSICFFSFNCYLCVCNGAFRGQWGREVLVCSHW